MKKIAFAFMTALLISSASFATMERTGPSSINHNNITEQINDQIASSHIIDYVDQAQGVDLTFMIDSQQRLVVLNIDGTDTDFVDRLKSELRGLQLSVEDHQLEKVYKIHVDFEVRN